MNTPRPEFPRPDFERKNWMTLNGEWDFQFDRENELTTIDQVSQRIFDDKIIVPFCYESKLSGIGKWEDCKTIWYRKTISLSADQITPSVLLKFGAVDYDAYVWVNDIYIGTHSGGHISFEFDIAYALQTGENTITVKAVDTLNTDKPRGKQSWIGEKFACWYTPTTGIWQSVWLEFTGKAFIKNIKITPDIDNLSAECEVYVSCSCPQKLTLTASFGFRDCEKSESKIQVTTKNGYAKAIFTFNDYDFAANHGFYWSPESPNLIDVKAELMLNDEVSDIVDTYFGMRKISVNGDTVLLNNMPYYQRLILDQGYWQDSLLTPPSDAAIIEDIKLTKSMGFNGARKHQKIEDPRYYYWADKLGLIVWGELPSSYEFNSNAVINSQREMSEFIMRDYNHPCIVTWVPLNESWGVRNIQTNIQQQNFARAMYYTIKALDKTRLISSNDGWEQIDANDICAIHDYAIFANNIDKYDNVEAVIERGLTGRMIYADGCKYEGKPLMMTEYGGIAFTDSSNNDWGYFGKVTNEEQFLARLEPVTDIFIKSRKYAGFCYTQLTDVMQEVNGLLTIDRKPKIDIEKLKAIFGKEWH